MICKKCAVAADMITIARKEKFDGMIIMPIARSSEDKSLVETNKAISTLATFFHGLCEFHGSKTDCDCQHQVVL